jgi:hypothetical protein
MIMGHLKSVSSNYQPRPDSAHQLRIRTSFALGNSKIGGDIEITTRQTNHFQHFMDRFLLKDEMD